MCCSLARRVAPARDAFLVRPAFLAARCRPAASLLLVQKRRQTLPCGSLRPLVRGPLAGHWSKRAPRRPLTKPFLARLTAALVKRRRQLHPRPARLRQPRWLSPAWLIALSPHVRTPRLCSRSLLLGGFLSGLLFVNVVTPCRGVVLRPAWSCLCGRLHLLRGYFPSVAWTPFRSARPNSTMAPTAIQCVAICSNTATQTSPRIPIKRPAR